MNNVKQIMTYDQLISLLQKWRIPYKNWGTVGQSKPVESLLEEINRGESILQEVSANEGMCLLRVVTGVYVKVTYANLVLKEEKAVWKNSDRPPRVRVTPASVLGKVAYGETTVSAALREVEEELQIRVDDPKRLRPIGYRDRFDQSYSFPGLPTLFKESLFELALLYSEYNEDGYREDQMDKTTYFAWTGADEDVVQKGM